MLFGDEPRFYKDLKPLYEGGGLFAHGEVSHVASRFVARVRADNLYLFFTECKKSDVADQLHGIILEFHSHSSHKYYKLFHTQTNETSSHVGPGAYYTQQLENDR